MALRRFPRIRPVFFALCAALGASGVSACADPLPSESTALEPSLAAGAPPADALDPSFGLGGKATADLGTIFDVARAVALQSDGKIVAAGNVRQQSRSSDFGLARLNADGTLDVHRRPAVSAGHDLHRVIDDCLADLADVRAGHVRRRVITTGDLR